MADNGGTAARTAPLTAGTSAPARSKLALALDFDDSVVAMRWAARMRDCFAVAKVGLELFSAAGPSVVAELLEAGFKVFVDLKLADIPTTTRRAARVLGTLGVSYLTLHACAGPRVLQAGAEGFAEGAEKGGLPAPMALAVTVLTSDPEAGPELLRSRARMAADAGCGGVVCAASDLADVKAVSPQLFAAVAGIRLVGSGRHDQSRVAGPGQAVRAGAGLLVVGRAVTEAPDPEEAATAVMREVAAALPS